MSAPSIPQHYWLFPHVSGGMALDTTVGGSLNSTITATATTTVVGDPTRPLATLLIGDPNKPIATKSEIEILNLPRFTLKDIKDMMKVRMRIPNYSQVCFKMFGQEFFSICISGEGQVITEPYVPNSLERCEEECCEPDTRPFPEPRNG